MTIAQWTFDEVDCVAVLELDGPPAAADWATLRPALMDRIHDDGAVGLRAIRQDDGDMIDSEVAHFGHPSIGWFETQALYSTETSLASIFLKAVVDRFVMIC